MVSQNDFSTPQYVNISPSQAEKILKPYDLAIPPLNLYPEELKAYSGRDIFTLMFITALFTIAKT